MSDLYREILVKRATPAADRIKQGGLIGLTVVCWREACCLFAAASGRDCPGGG